MSALSFWATGNRQQATGNRQQATGLIVILLLFNLTTTQAQVIDNTVSSASNWSTPFTQRYGSAMEACVATVDIFQAHPPGYYLLNPSVISATSPTGYWSCLFGTLPGPPYNTPLSFSTTTAVLSRGFLCPAHSALVSTNQITGGRCACYSQFNFIADATDTQCVCPQGQQLDSTGIRCVAACPVNAEPSNDPNNPCVCRAGYEWDATHTSCVSSCPVPDLTPLPQDDLCAQSLEAGHGTDVNGACPQVSDALTNELQCFSNKIAVTNALARPPIPYAGPTATIRNTAYQAHMQEVWDTLIELNKPDNRNNESCQSLREKIATEKGCGAQGHCIKYRPATFSNHSTGRAFDVSQRAIDGLVRELTPLPPAPMTVTQRLQFQRNAIAGWLSSPTACNLIWGGSFQDADIFHFQLP